MHHTVMESGSKHRRCRTGVPVGQQGLPERCRIDNLFLNPKGVETGLQRLTQRF